MAVPEGAVAALLRVWVLRSDGRRFAHDAVDAEGALRMRTRLWLCVLSEVFRPTALPVTAQSLWQEVIGRGRHHDALLQGHVADGGSVRGAHLALDAVWLPVRPVAVQVGIKHKSFFGELGVVSLEALPSPEEAAVVEHVLGGRVQGPVVTFARVPRLPRDLNETVVEGEVVPDGVLPGGELVSVVGKLVADEVTDATQRQLLQRALQDGHGDEGDVGVGRLHRAALDFPGRRCVCAEAVLTFPRGVRLRRVKLSARFCRGAVVRGALISIQTPVCRLILAHYVNLMLI